MIDRLLALAGRRPAAAFNLDDMIADIVMGRTISRNPRIDVAWQARAYTQACKWQAAEVHPIIARRIAEALAADWQAGRYTLDDVRGYYFWQVPTPPLEGGS